MELTLKRLLEQAEFTRAKRGYDANEVDDFLDRAVAMATKVEARLTQALEESRGAPEPEGAPEPKGPTPAEIEAEVDRRVKARLAEAPPAPGPVPAAPPALASEEETAEEVRRTIVLAQRTADAAVREARQDAARLLNEAKDRAAALNDEADNTLAAARLEMAREIDAERRIAQERLAGEIGELEGAREALRSDITVLERYVGQQRNQLRTTVDDLQRLLDDPAGFRTAPEPALLDPVVPSPIVTARPAGALGQGDDSDDGGTGRSWGSGGSSSSWGGTGAATAGAGTEGGGSEAPVEQTAVVIDDEAYHAADPEPPSGSAGGPSSSGQADATASPAPASTGGSASDGDEDAFLDELRRAMADDEPLGPRDDPGSELSDEDRRSWRFGKRR
jgi:DivIVA domain-containing protein